MRVFITGIGSFIGGHVATACDAAGHDVSGVDLAAVGRSACHVADIRSPDIADVIPEGADVVLHLAALSRDSDCRGRMREVLDVNVAGTLNIAAAAQARKARQVIFASTEWVYDRFEPAVDKTEAEPIDCASLTSEYAASKYMAENVLRLQLAGGNAALTVLRLGIVYGPRHDNWSAVEALLDTVAHSDEVTIGCRRTGRHFIHVRDVADAAVACFGLAGAAVLNVQGARLVTLGEIVEASARLFDRHPVVHERDPIHPSIRNVDGTAIRHALGWQPRIDIEAGLRSVAIFLGLPVTD